MTSISGDENLRRLFHRVAGLASRELRPFSDPDLSLDVEDQPVQRKSLDQGHVASSDLLRLILTTAGHGVDLGAADKRLWEIRFAYKGQECLIYFAKSGIKLLVALKEELEPGTGLVDEIDNRLTKAVENVMKHGVQPLIDLKLLTNDAIVVNQHTRYLSMFEYLRSLLVEMQLSELQIEDQEPVDPMSDAVTSVFKELFATRAKEEKISHLAIASLAAYFSMLEHRLVLLAAFRKDIAHLDFSLIELLGSGWRKKFHFAFAALPRESTNVHFADLEHLAQTYRNPLLHGGGGGDIDGLVVQWMPNFRSVVSARGKITNKYMLWTSPISVKEAEDILRRIDSLETWMTELPGYAWVKEGLAVDFDKGALEKYASHMASGTFDRFVDGSSQQFDRALNLE